MNPGFNRFDSGLLRSGDRPEFSRGSSGSYSKTQKVLSTIRNSRIANYVFDSRMFFIFPCI